jgi:hypothetical protein
MQGWRSRMTQQRRSALLYIERIGIRQRKPISKPIITLTRS